MTTFADCAMLTATLHPELASYRWPDTSHADEETVASLVASLPETPAELVDLPSDLPAVPTVEQPAERSEWLVRALSFGRFVLVGSLSTVLSSLLFLLLGTWMAAAIANTIATVLTTVVSNQAHAKWTFSSERRGAGMHLRAGLSVAVTYPITTVALLGLEWLHPHAGSGLELVVLLAASGVAGLLRYILLLVGVFPDSPAAFDRTEPQADDTHDADPRDIAVDAGYQAADAGYQVVLAGSGRVR